jgi:heat shock protein HtpX
MPVESMVRRAAITLILMVSFYAIALGLIFGLLAIAVAQIASEGFQARVGLGCVLAAGCLLWAVVPRSDTFEAPGPAVEKSKEPQLFAALESVAEKTGQELPAEVYLVDDVNAFVTSRGGVMGFGSRRVMGLGLPLMQAVSVQEFMAILAHEFGHYHRGGVALGPWIHKTRVAIGRTIQQLESNVLQFLFVWYGKLFLRVTHAISRNQELVADEIAARAAGAGAMISGLRTVHATSVAYHNYVQQELAPVVQRGYLPPVSAGFTRFLGISGMDAFLDVVVQYEEEQGATDPLDTHPSLKDRIAALRKLPEGTNGDTRRASALLSDVLEWERRVHGPEAGPEWARDLEPIEWDRVVEAVYMPMWRARVDHHGHLLRAYTIGTLPTTTAEFVELGSLLFEDDEEQQVTDHARLGRAWQLIVAAVALRLTALGWLVEALPGNETILRRGSDDLRPYSELQAVLDNRLSVSQWHDRCRSLGIADVRLWGALVGNDDDQLPIANSQLPTSRSQGFPSPASENPLGVGSWSLGN